MAYRKIIRPKGTSSSVQKGGIYVYATAEKRYNREKKYNNNKRVCIGKMIDNEYMMPNDKFSEFFPDIEIDEAAEEAAMSDTVKVGTTFLIDHIFSKTQMDKLLGNVFPEAADYLQDLVTYNLITEDNVMQYYDAFTFEHRIMGANAISDTSISRLLKETDTEGIELFLRAWNQLHKNREAVYISYDSANINTTAEGIEMAEYGHAKEDNDIPVVNYSVAYDQDRSIPLFYETYPGSVIDNTQCDVMVERANEYGHENVGFILDRGYFSAGNIKHLTKQGYAFILMAKGNAKFVRDAVEEVRLAIRLSVKYYIAEHEVYGTTAKRKLFNEDKARYFHIYYDDVRAAQEREVFLRRLKKTEEVLERKVEKKLSRKEDLRSYEKYYLLKFDGNGYFQSYKRRDSIIQKELDKFGYFVLITSEKMTASEALSKYRDRDAIEKLFRTIKSLLGMDTFRIHETSSMEGKSFLAFLASIIWNEMYLAMKPVKKEEKDRKHYTVPAMMKEMEKIFITKDAKGNYRKKYALTARQKKILRAFGLEEKNLDTYIRKLSPSLKARSAV